MNPETQGFLESVRGAEDPTPADERRVLLAVRATLGVGAVIGTATAAPKLARLFAWSSAGGFKTGAAVFCLLALGGVAAVQWVRTPSHAGAPVATPSVAHRHPVPASHPAIEPALANSSAPPPASRSERTVPTRGPARSERASVSATPPAASSPSAGTALGEELAVLARAQAALRRGDGAGALSTLAAFPPREPQLAAERATLRILSLCRLGRLAEARHEAASLERREPGSLQRDVISRSCAGVGKPPQR